MPRRFVVVVVAVDAAVDVAVDVAGGVGCGSGGGGGGAYEGGASGRRAGVLARPLGSPRWCCMSATLRFMVHMLVRWIDAPTHNACRTHLRRRTWRTTMRLGIPGTRQATAGTPTLFSLTTTSTTLCRRRWQPPVWPWKVYG